MIKSSSPKGKLFTILREHKPVEDLKLTFQHLGGISISLPNRKKDMLALILSLDNTILALRNDSATDKLSLVI